MTARRRGSKYGALYDVAPLNDWSNLLNDRLSCKFQHVGIDAVERIKRHLSSITAPGAINDCLNLKKRQATPADSKEAKTFLAYKQRLQIVYTPFSCHLVNKITNKLGKF